MNRYSAPWGRSLKLLTLLGSLVLFVVPLAALAASDFTGALSLVIVLPLLIWAATLPFMVTGYELSAGQLRIARLGWATVYPLRELRAVEYQPGVMAGSLRMFGNGGLFAISGWFRNKALGRYRAFVTDPDRSVVVRFADRTIVVSPGEQERFVAALRGYVSNGDTG
ncbi:MAG: hypothetical protein HKO62_02745 [Gammaproteobacteria bacterium]|nr:PH domain-containing protein [Gammaproteobacteria bacterium]NNL99640.1 hypothetical protein [Gammaproteobacteria bacterium]